MKLKNGRLLLFFCFILLFFGCVSVDRGKKSLPGPEILDRLRGGMTMEEVIRILGKPTSLVTIHSEGTGESWHELNYSDTLIDPGVVELYFRPGLSLIRIDTDIYREYDYE